MSGDTDGDQKTDFVVFRPSDNTWYVLTAANRQSSAQFGATNDVPMLMDYEGDGRANFAVFRGGTWYIAKPTGVPSQNFYALPFGLTGDSPVPADFDGDGRDDLAVFRPSNGIWYVMRSSTSSVAATQFGAVADQPVPGDYDGDGSDDIAVFRNGAWYMLRSTAGFAAASFGTSSDIPVPRRYIP
jgi:spore coat protein A, manganese oxidase